MQGNNGGRRNNKRSLYNEKATREKINDRHKAILLSHNVNNRIVWQIENAIEKQQCASLIYIWSTIFIAKNVSIVFLYRNVQVSYGASTSVCVWVFVYCKVISKNWLYVSALYLDSSNALGFPHSLCPTSIRTRLISTNLCCIHAFSFSCAASMSDHNFSSTFIITWLLLGCERLIDRKRGSERAWERGSKVV